MMTFGESRKNKTMTDQNNDDLLPTRFAEIRVSGGRRVRIKVSNDDGRLIWGFGVDRHGVVPRGGTKHTEARQFFACAPQDVIRELRMSKHYGELVPLTVTR